MSLKTEAESILGLKLSCSPHEEWDNWYSDGKYSGDSVTQKFNAHVLYKSKIPVMIQLQMQALGLMIRLAKAKYLVLQLSHYICNLY